MLLEYFFKLIHCCILTKSNIIKYACEDDSIIGLLVITINLINQNDNPVLQ